MSTAWIIPSNRRTFDSEAAFRDIPEVNWSEADNAHIAVGDDVYLYTTGPIAAITHKCVVTAVQVPPSQLIDDGAYWRDPAERSRRLTERNWMRLKKRDVFDDVARGQLELRLLREHGLRGNVPGRQRVPAELLEYILQVEAPTRGDDSGAEASDVDRDEVEVFKVQIRRREFAVPDRSVQAKTRGSAQRAFADQVKSNYGNQCAITGITTPAFLIASHIVPWSEDESIRLDPSNGICLSTLVDRAFDTGFLTVSTDYTVHIDGTKIALDEELFAYLSPYEGRSIRMPSKDPPRVEYLVRRLDRV
ncbi:HNH endonuclease [Paenarthrobacter nitroguajacolicus]|uniref:HNH endonuclease n=1 Tax=Paenarthrobacter nitroguajacolicus TaxID=211146 RepID=UPI00248B1371|nr:HNH endonuclease signature motif containing protein [Paenarthrobacter nitroguajacolicus]MDI2035935.1 hypothetical protein [Paenarthrobacter nitroguajacolicus]